MIDSAKLEERKKNICLKCGKEIHSKQKFCLSCGIIMEIRQHYPHNLL